jgi:ABC-type branched-subunit amino acid transport system substrate-binding protein
MALTCRGGATAARDTTGSGGGRRGAPSGRGAEEERPMRARGWTARGAWATALAGLAGFLLALEPVEASHTIKIGIAGPMTGGDAKMGQEFEKVGRLALEERKGMVAGHKIEFLVEDDKSDPKEAVSVANKLVNGGVKAVIGHYNSSCTIPASDIYNEASIVHITPTSSNPKITERGYKMLYRIITRDDQQGVFVADYLKDVAKAKRVAIIHDKTTYGQGLAEETQKALEKLGIKPVFFEAITRGEKDFTPVVTKLKATNPDYSYFTGYYAEGGILVRQFRDVGVPGTFFAGDANQDPVFIETAGKAGEGVIMSTAPLPEQVPAAAEFLKKFIAKYGPGPGPFVHYDFDAFNILFAAMEGAGKEIDNPKAVSAEIRKVKDYKGASGTITFNDKGDVLGREKQFIVLVIKDGKFTTHWAPKM